MRQQVLLDHLKPETGRRAAANVVVSFLIANLFLLGCDRAIVRSCEIGGYSVWGWGRFALFNKFLVSSMASDSCDVVAICRCLPHGEQSVKRYFRILHL